MTIKQSFFYNGKSHDVYFMFDVSGTYGGKFLSSNFTDKIFEYNMVLSASASTNTAPKASSLHSISVRCSSPVQQNKT